MNQQANGKAVTKKETFGRETAVSIDINAAADTVWALLTDGGRYPEWNSTVTSIEGQIKQGGQIALKSTLDEKRTFKLDVKAFEPPRRLVWADRQGERVYTLTPAGDGVRFTMAEKIGGLLYPLYGRFIPAFDESFEQFAADLKRAAESG